MAARRGALALRVRKDIASGAMRVVARGVSEDLAAFNADLHHKARDNGWLRDELTTTEEDVTSILGGALRIVRSDDLLTSGVESSGRAPPGASSEPSSIDTGSTASSRLIVAEVRRERERGEATLAAKLAEAAAREAAALEAALAAPKAPRHNLRLGLAQCDIRGERASDYGYREAWGLGIS